MAEIFKHVINVLQSFCAISPNVNDQSITGIENLDNTTRKIFNINGNSRHILIVTSSTSKRIARKELKSYKLVRECCVILISQQLVNSTHRKLELKDQLNKSKTKPCGEDQGIKCIRNC